MCFQGRHLWFCLRTWHLNPSTTQRNCATLAITAEYLAECSLDYTCIGLMDSMCKILAAKCPRQLNKYMTKLRWWTSTQNECKMPIERLVHLEDWSLMMRLWATASEQHWSREIEPLQEVKIQWVFGRSVRRRVWRKYFGCRLAFLRKRVAEVLA